MAAIGEQLVDLDAQMEVDRVTATRMLCHPGARTDPLRPSTQALLKAHNIPEPRVSSETMQIGGVAVAPGSLAARMVSLCCAQREVGTLLNSVPDPQIEQLNALISSGQHEAALDHYMQVRPMRMACCAWQPCRCANPHGRTHTHARTLAARHAVPALGGRDPVGRRGGRAITCVPGRAAGSSGAPRRAHAAAALGRAPPAGAQPRRQPDRGARAAAARRAREQGGHSCEAGVVEGGRPGWASRGGTGARPQRRHRRPPTGRRAVASTACALLARPKQLACRTAPEHLAAASQDINHMKVRGTDCLYPHTHNLAGSHPP